MISVTEDDDWQLVVTTDNLVAKIDLLNIESKKRNAKGSIAIKISRGSVVKLSTLKNDSEKIIFNDKTYLVKKSNCNYLVKKSR